MAIAKSLPSSQLHTLNLNCMYLHPNTVLAITNRLQVIILTQKQRMNLLDLLRLPSSGLLRCAVRFASTWFSTSVYDSSDRIGSRGCGSHYQQSTFFESSRSQLGKYVRVIFIILECIYPTQARRILILFLFLSVTFVGCAECCYSQWYMCLCLILWLCNTWLIDFCSSQHRSEVSYNASFASSFFQDTHASFK